MSKGIYNETYFRNNPEECDLEAVLYCVVLVNKNSMKRECIKIGIAKGRNWKDVIRRSSGFRGYEIRIQKVVHGRLEDIYYLEQYLHELWQGYKFTPEHKFGGHTELFQLNDEIIRSVPESC
jgi:hypothetical protein